MNKYIVELLDLYSNAAEYLNWAEEKGFELMFINSLSNEAMCFFKKRDVVDVRDFRPSQREFEKWFRETHK